MPVISKDVTVCPLCSNVSEMVKHPIQKVNYLESAKLLIWVDFFVGERREDGVVSAAQSREQIGLIPILKKPKSQVTRTV